MASPRTMWSGSIELGLLNIPITIGKASSEQRESSLVQVNLVHTNSGVEAHRINRSERDAVTGEPPGDKRLAIEIDDGQFRIVDDSEFAAIERATKTPTLVVQDVQPLNTLPIMYATGCYYVRHDKKAKVQPTAFAHLMASMAKDRLGLICKWGNSSRQKLVVLSAESGVMILRVIPFLSDIRVASKVEREHFSVKLEESKVEQMSKLLSAVRNPNGFAYGKYEDEGLKLRTEIVERIVSGETIPVETPVEPEIDPFEQIELAIENAKARVTP